MVKLMRCRFGMPLMLKPRRPPDMKLTYWRPPSLSKVGDGGYFTTWDTIQKMPNALAHFTRAIEKSLAVIHDDPAKALEIYWEVNPSGKPKGSDAEAHKIGLKELEVLGRSFDLSGVPAEVDVPSLNAYIKTFVDMGLITKAPHRLTSSLPTHSCQSPRQPRTNGPSNRQCDKRAAPVG